MTHVDHSGTLMIKIVFIYQGVMISLTALLSVRAAVFLKFDM